MQISIDLLGDLGSQEQMIVCATLFSHIRAESAFDSLAQEREEAQKIALARAIGPDEDV